MHSRRSSLRLISNIMLTRGQIPTGCAGRCHGRSDSLANMNDSDGEIEETSITQKPEAPWQSQEDTRSGRTRAVHFQHGKTTSQQNTDEQVEGRQDTAVYTSHREAISARADDRCQHNGAATRPAADTSQEAIAQVIARSQAAMEEKNLQLSKVRPKTVDWLRLRRVPGDPKHLNARTRLRVAVLSESLLPCSS